MKAFANGAVVDEFTGALPKPAVESFLRRLIPSESDRLAREATRRRRGVTVSGSCPPTARSDDAGRRAMVALFSLFGDAHELTREYRGRLGAVLF